jgi:hypothetical protein
MFVLAKVRFCYNILDDVKDFAKRGINFKLKNGITNSAQLGINRTM